MSGDHFGSYGDPPSNSERATKRAIENLKGERNQIRQLETELADKDRQLAEARAEIERKDKLIERMREALRLALPEARSTHCENTVKAALAAERGE